MGEKSKGRKTRLITYNLYERGRKITGIDRSNVDMKAMIALIQSASTQEVVNAGQMYGYYGHEIRARYGMTPPDSVEINGKMVMLAPCCRTLELTVDNDGNVSHRQEFLDNEQGEFARLQYLAKVGGFSTSITYNRELLGGLTPVLLAGFDYVAQPNYVQNTSDGALFDGLFVPNNQTDANLVSCFDSATDLSALAQPQATIARMLESSILNQFDSINAQIALMQSNEIALDELAQIHRQQRKSDLQKQRNAERATGMIGTVSSFDSVCAQAESYLDQMNLSQKQEEQEHKQEPLAGRIIESARKMFSFGG